MGLLEDAIAKVQADLATLGTKIDSIIAALKASGQVPQADLDALAAVSAGMEQASANLDAANPPKP